MSNVFNATRAVINTDKARNNLNILKSMLPSNAKPVCVIKANAYGHGDVALMRLYQENGADFFAVSNIAEAVKLRENDCNGEIIILSGGYSDKDTAELLVKHDITETIISHEQAKELSANATGKIRTHIKLDTGMGRVGLDAFEHEMCVKQILDICNLRNISVEGIFTHFAVADSMEQSAVEYTNEQRERFFRIIDECGKHGVKFKYTHWNNSGGAILHGERCGDSNSIELVRLGIALYGLKPDKTMTLPDGIEPILELKAPISQVRTIKKGQSVGYGRTYTAERDIQAAVVHIGYADGYPRSLSNKGSALINGQKAPVIGRVSMDQMTIDVTDIADVKAGDTATLIGKDGDEIITADLLADLTGTINYEIVCGISQRVPRIYHMDFVIPQF